MSNSSVIQRMSKVLEDYESGILTSEQVENAIGFQMEALECIGLKTLHEARDLSSRLVHAHCYVGEEEFINGEEVAAALRAFREFFKGLPGSP